MYDKIKLIDQIKRQIVKREIETMKKINHINIINFIKKIENNDSVNIVMEYGGTNTLKQYLQDKKEKGVKLYELESKGIFRQLVSAIAYLHNLDLVHLDLKLENILLLEPVRKE